MASNSNNITQVNFVDSSNPTLEEVIAFMKVSEQSYSLSTPVSIKQTVDNGNSTTNERKLVSKHTYDYYWGNRQLKMLEKEMQQRFKHSWLTRRKSVENVTKTIVDSISVVYKSPPQRVISSELPIGISESERNTFMEEREETQKLYDQIMKDAKADENFQKLERYQNFDRTNLIQIRYVESEERIKLNIVPQFLFDVILDQDGKLSAVILSDFIEEERSEERKFWVWTKDSYYKLDGEYSMLPNPDNPTNVNPDGVLPFVLVRSVEPDTGIYCDADLNIANLNLNINLLLTDALHLAEFQVHGQLIGENVKFSAEVEWGPETLVQYESQNPDQSTKLEFLKPEADFQGLFDTANRILGGFANSRGLPINMFSVDKQSVESGVALKIRNAPLIELRESMEETYRNIEADLLDIVTTVWNNNASSHGAGTIPEELTANIIYNRPDDAFESIEEKIGTLMLLKANGLIKKTEIIKELKPSFNDEDARKYLEEIEEENQEFGGLPVDDMPSGDDDDGPSEPSDDDDIEDDDEPKKDKKPKRDSKVDDAVRKALGKKKK
jgi:hypothetical protein